jgi:protein-S-isoprenylcysteine O-methyltransferase Ste14
MAEDGENGGADDPRDAAKTEDAAVEATAPPSKPEEGAEAKKKGKGAYRTKTKRDAQDADDEEEEVVIPESRKHLDRLAATRTRRALFRWIALGAILALLWVLYFQHPYYRGGQFTPWRSLYPFLCALWGLFGLPYTIVTLKKYEQKKVRAFWMGESALHWMVIGRAFWGTKKYSRLSRREGGPRHAGLMDYSRILDFPVIGFVWRRKRLKNTVLALAVKGFFSPLMTGFVSGHLTAVGNMWAQKKGMGTLPILDPNVTPGQLWPYLANLGGQLVKLIPSGADFGALFSGANYTVPNVRWGFDLLYNMVFIVDCGVALFGYLSESRWLGNKTRSVEPTGLGWVVAIFCYPPFNNILGTYVPFGDRPEEWSKSEMVRLAIQGATIAFFVVYSAATVAFGAKFSNLTNRGIIKRGPYAIIRHPAYTCKCIAWWLEHANRMTPQTALALIGLCGVYALRAWTEERHLSQDPDYVAYKKKVRWAAIPGLF